MTLAEVINTLQTWIRNADDEYDREEMGRVAGLKEALHEIKKIKPCEDAISRQAVLELPKRTIKNYFGEVVGDVVYIDDIKGLPPITPKPKTGHWILTDKRDEIYCLTAICSVCGNESINAGIDEYCPNCGVKMEASE